MARLTRLVDILAEDNNTISKDGVYQMDAWRHDAYIYESGKEPIIKLFNSWSLLTQTVEFIGDWRPSVFIPVDFHGITQHPQLKKTTFAITTLDAVIAKNIDTDTLYCPSRRGHWSHPHNEMRSMVEELTNNIHLLNKDELRHTMELFPQVAGALGANELLKIFPELKSN